MLYAKRAILLLCAAASASAWVQPLLPRGASGQGFGARVGSSTLLAAAGPSDVGAALGRRTLLQQAGAISLCTAAVALGSAVPAQAATGSLTLERAVYLIVRVQEGTLQEERLISSGKFKDLQRANIKAAAQMLLRNYQLDDCITIASKQVVDKAKIVDALDAGRTAEDALNQITEYFDSAEGSLKVNALDKEKQGFVLRALGTARSNLDAFLGYLPPKVVAAARAQVLEENDLNKKEYRAPDGSAEYLNPAPAGASL